jgi:putative transposase
MRLIDEQYTATPFFGSPRMTAWLRRHGHGVNHKRVERLMREMGLVAIYPRPRKPWRGGPAHHLYPYLLRDVAVIRPDQVWASDITYIRLLRGFVYLVAVLDWFSRYVLAWAVSVSMESDFCVGALDWALQRGAPEIFNTDQGSQFTAESFTKRLSERGIQISMDGRGRCWDNIFVERLWRSVKYEEVYLRDYVTVPDAVQGLSRYFLFYNTERPHQALSYRTPEEVYFNRVTL